MYSCANCNKRGCSAETTDQLPAVCPMRDQILKDGLLEEYSLPENHEFYVKASELEAIGYGTWTRLRETIELCKAMNYKRVGLAFCRGLSREAMVIDGLLRKHEITPVSVVCKTGAVPKEEAGIPADKKLHPESFEPMCNPIAQAKLLNEQKTQFNILVGLCVGHDSFFYKYSEALVTTLIVKDRVLAHNPAGAVYCSQGYFKDKL